MNEHLKNFKATKMEVERKRTQIGNQMDPKHLSCMV